MTATKPRLDAKGDCYRANGRLFLEMCETQPALEPTTRLCHGWVTPRTGRCANRCFHHAWVEVSDVVFDHSNGGRDYQRREAYYRAGRIDESLVIRYAYRDVIARIVQHESWDLGTI